MMTTTAARRDIHTTHCTLTVKLLQHKTAQSKMHNMIHLLPVVSKAGLCGTPEIHCR